MDKLLIATKIAADFTVVEGDPNYKPAIILFAITGFILLLGIVLTMIFGGISPLTLSILALVVATIFGSLLSAKAIEDADSIAATATLQNIEETYKIELINISEDNNVWGNISKDSNPSFREVFVKNDGDGEYENVMMFFTNEDHIVYTALVTISINDGKGQLFAISKEKNDELVPFDEKTIAVNHLSPLVANSITKE